MKPTGAFPNDIIALKHFNVIAGAGIKLKTYHSRKRTQD
jgi:hypothetical protein